MTSATLARERHLPDSDLKTSTHQAGKTPEVSRYRMPQIAIWVRVVRTGDVSGWRTVVSEIPLGGERTVTPIAVSVRLRRPHGAVAEASPDSSTKWLTMVCR